MTTAGPNYPSTVTTNAAAPENANDWLTPGNISAADGSEAQITAATYDSPDISYQLIAANFGFSIPAGATIDGVTVAIDRRCFAGTAADNRVQLRDASGALFGANKATATAWPGTSAVATYGGATDLWTASITPAIVNDPDFGVVVSVKATSANTDIGIDFVRVTVDYTYTAPVDLAPADTSHSHSTENVVLTQTHVLAGLADTGHSHTADAVTIGQTHVLAVADTAHGHTTENVVLSIPVNLTVADTEHGHTTEAVTIGQTHVLVGVADTSHAHGNAYRSLAVLTDENGIPILADGEMVAVDNGPSDTLDLLLEVDLAVADTGHGHATENVELGQTHQLGGVADTSNAHGTDAVVITQTHVLTVADTSHAHTTEHLTLPPPGETQIHADDSAHAHTTENVELVQTHRLTVADTSHGHATENVTLAQVHVLVVTDSAHGHTADHVVLGGFDFPGTASSTVTAPSASSTVTAASATSTVAVATATSTVATATATSTVEVNEARSLVEV